MKIMVLLVSLLPIFGCSSPGNGLENDTMTYFSLRSGGGMNRLSGFNYNIKETEDGQVHFIFNEGFPDEKEFTLDDHSVFDSLQQIVMKHEMYRYQGRYEPEFEIMDGTSWSLYIKYASRRRIDAGGYMAGPEGYGEAFREIRLCLDHWKNMPFGVNEVDTFLYVYDQERYTIGRRGEQAVLVYDNEATGEHRELERSLDMLEDLRITFNVCSLKMNNERGTFEEGYTPWMYDIIYKNGDHYHYESYDTGFRCGYTEMLQGFISNWMEEKEYRRPFYYYYY